MNTWIMRKSIWDIPRSSIVTLLGGPWLALSLSKPNWIIFILFDSLIWYKSDRLCPPPQHHHRRAAPPGPWGFPRQWEKIWWTMFEWKGYRMNEMSGMERWGRQKEPPRRRTHKKIFAEWNHLYIYNCLFIKAHINFHMYSIFIYLPALLVRPSFPHSLFSLFICSKVLICRFIANFLTTVVQAFPLKLMWRLNLGKEKKTKYAGKICSKWPFGLLY